MDLSLTSLVAGFPPFTWLRDLDEAIDEAWDTSDPLLRSDGPDPASLAVDEGGLERRDDRPTDLSLRPEA